MLELKNISVQFGGIKALNNVSFKIEKKSLFTEDKCTIWFIAPEKPKPKLELPSNNLGEGADGIQSQAT